MIRSKEIKLVRLDDIHPYEKNPHKHTKEQIERLARLIEYQGFRVPLIVCEETKRIAVGHCRYAAAKFLGLKEIPVMFQKFDSEDQFYAFVVSDNAIGKNEWAELDFAGINLEVPELGPDFNLDWLGIKDFELDAIDKYKNDPDSVPEAPKTPRSKLGDIYELGEYCECPKCGHHEM